MGFEKEGLQEKGREERSSGVEEGVSEVDSITSIKTFLQRVMDDDRLSDSCWNSEMREVELWENERFGGRFCFLFASLCCLIIH